MRIPFHSANDERQYLEPPRSPLIPLTCLLAVAAAVAIVGAQLGPRFALMTAAFAGVALLTRVPRVLPVTAALTLLVALFAVKLGGQNAAAIGAHVQHMAVAHAHGARR